MNRLNITLVAFGGNSILVPTYNIAIAHMQQYRLMRRIAFSFPAKINVFCEIAKLDCTYCEYQVLYRISLCSTAI